ncbi:MAG: flagellar FliJ family protein [Deltaproteobacteria bacterium]|nr:flagellar FliJ family protein [Deltaproteobacteria bacterium]
MKKFKFRLERVLQFRTAVKDEKLRELTLKNVKLREEQDRLSALEGAMRRNQNEAEGVVLIESFYMRGLYSSRLKEEIVNQRLTIIKCEEEVREAMAAYIEASKELKSLTTLKDRKRTEYLEYVAHEDAKFLDELATQKGNTFKAQS